MPLIEWTNIMSVGLPELDEDHRVLIRIINDLNENRDGDAQSLRASFEHLKHYAEFHFAREEAVMRAVGYSAQHSHQHEHRDFETRMRELSTRLEVQPDSASEEINEKLLHFLKNWLQHHILVIDKDYKSYVEDSAKAARIAKEFKASHLWYS